MSSEFPSSMSKILPPNTTDAHEVQFADPIDRICFGYVYKSPSIVTSLYALSNKGEIWQSEKEGDFPPPKKISDDAVYKYIAADQKGNVYSVRDNGEIYQYNGTPNAWTLIGYSATMIAADDGKLFAVASSWDSEGKKSDGCIWEYNGAPKNWTIIGNSTKTIDARAGRLLKVTFNGFIDEYNGTPNDWMAIGNPTETFAATMISLGSDNLYAIDTEKNAYAYLGQPKSWKKFGTNIKMVSATDLGFPVVITEDNILKTYMSKGFLAQTGTNIKTVASLNNGDGFGFIESSNDKVVKTDGFSTMDDTLGTFLWKDQEPKL